MGIRSIASILVTLAGSLTSCEGRNPRLIVVDAGHSMDRGSEGFDAPAKIDTPREDAIEVGLDTVGDAVSANDSTDARGIDREFDARATDHGSDEGGGDTPDGSSGLDADATETGADIHADLSPLDAGAADARSDTTSDARVDAEPPRDVPCGAPGQACCGFNCNAGAECSLAGLGLRCETAACGGDLQRCCGVGICAAGFDCTTPVVGRCERCGARSQRCCGTMCNSGLTCRGTVPPTCI